MLCDDGLAVRSTANGHEALDYLGGVRPDAIVLDFVLPLMDGRTFFRMARDAGVTSPVLLLAATGARKAAAALSADGYLEMPFEPVQLSASVRELLNRNPRVS